MLWRNPGCQCHNPHLRDISRAFFQGSCTSSQTQRALQQRRRQHGRLSGAVALLQALADTGSAAAAVSPAKEALRPTQAKASPSKDAIHFHQQPKKVSSRLCNVTRPGSR